MFQKLFDVFVDEDRHFLQPMEQKLVDDITRTAHWKYTVGRSAYLKTCASTHALLGSALSYCMPGKMYLSTTHLKNFSDYAWLMGK
uniref:Uncharacterized protein n=1 Tax=Romanomermis culicivorax TaxID=13658 RepID=A0A915ICY1_ROMCU